MNRGIRLGSRAGTPIALFRPRFASLEEATVSVYRKFDAMRLPSNDVYARREPSSKQPEGSVTSPQDSSREEEYKRRRKAQPVNVPLLRTLDWVARVPPSVKPTALLRQYARIANVIAATWDDPNSFRSYVDCLFRNDRGNRKGLPPDVLLELQALREYRGTFNAEDVSSWAVVRKRG
jgi:hypothetical protein